MMYRHCILARNQWAAGKISSKLQTMPEILKNKKQTSSKHVFRTRGSNIPMDKGCDCYLSLQEDLYFLIVDYTSRFPVVCKLTSTTVEQVANWMKLIFSEYGWPETIVSNNRPCYSAETFTKLMTDYSVNHITSFPHYLQSNDLAEKYVQIVKNLFYKAQEQGTDLYKSLMIYRNTLISNRLQSPMQILQSQTARTQSPMSNVTRAQQGLGSEQLRMNSKNKHLPTHDLYIHQSVMYLTL